MDKKIPVYIRAEVNHESETVTSEASGSAADILKLLASVVMTLADTMTEQSDIKVTSEELVGTLTDFISDYKQFEEHDCDNCDKKEECEEANKFHEAVLDGLDNFFSGGED